MRKIFLLLCFWAIIDQFAIAQNARPYSIPSPNATDYDWNVGGGIKRNAFIHINNILLKINPQIHGFKTYYYGVGTLRK